MKRTLKALLALVRIRASGVTVYRLSFFTGFFVDTITFGVQLLFLDLLARQSATAWTPEMYSVFVGTFLTLDGLWMSTWFFGLVELPSLIRTGQLDLILLRPVRPLLYLSFHKVDFGSLLLPIVGAIITLGAAARGGMLTVGTTALWLAAMGLMYVLMYALSLLLRVSAFWTISTEAANVMENTLIESAMRLPLPAIKDAYRLVLLLLLPYGLVGNFPALALAGQTVWTHWLYAAVLTGAFLALALALWRAGLRRYESASS
ncbi:MAG: ABC-2 family transporter protein [Eubacteriales bacterium]|nr:ABC-2 family transporter protein [Eubacteriales bacterium]